MLARSFNRYSLSSLSLAVLSAGLLSCGGGGDNGGGSCLPTGSTLNMVLDIADEVNPDNRGSFTIQLFGNDTDLPEAKIQGAAADPAIPAMTHMVYRRENATAAYLKGNFILAQGQITLPGPIVLIFYGTAQVNMNITFNASTEYENATGTCTGTVEFVSGQQQGGDIVAGNPWRGTEGRVNYQPNSN